MNKSAHQPRRIPSKNWRELIKVWEADPLRCAKCSREMRIVSLIDEEDVIERILRHLGPWQQGVRVHSGTDPRSETTLDPWLDERVERAGALPGLDATVIGLCLSGGIKVHLLLDHDGCLPCYGVITGGKTHEIRAARTEKASVNAAPAVAPRARALA